MFDFNYATTEALIRLASKHVAEGRSEESLQALLCAAPTHQAAENAMAVAVNAPGIDIYVCHPDVFLTENCRRQDETFLEYAQRASVWIECVWNKYRKGIG